MEVEVEKKINKMITQTRLIKSQFLTVHVTLYVVYRQVIGALGHHKLLTFLYWKKIKKFTMGHG